MGIFTRDIGIDLGTANTLVHLRGKGITLREPTVVAINKKNNNEVLEVGEKAKNMIGRTPGNIVAIKPMRGGVIADFDITQKLLKYFIKNAAKKRIFFRTRIVICIPSGVTEVEKRAVRDSAEAAGANEIYLLEEPMAAAIGAGLPVAEASGSMIVDIGGGTFEVAVISLGGIVTSESLRIAEDQFDESIVSYIKKAHNLVIGERTAEEIKLKIGSAYKGDEEKSMEIKGRDVITGLPEGIVVFGEEIREALREPVSQIIDSIRKTLEKTPPELSADIISKGITLTGGGALLSGLDKRINAETGMPVNIAENPLECVARGAGMALESMEILRKIAVYERR